MEKELGENKGTFPVTGERNYNVQKEGHMYHRTRFLVPSEKSYLWMQIEQILFEWLCMLW